MQRRIDQPTERFSRRARGLPPNSDSTSTKSNETESSSIPSNVHIAPSVHTVHTQNTNTAHRSTSPTVSQVTLFPEETLERIRSLQSHQPHYIPLANQDRNHQNQFQNQHNSHFQHMHQMPPRHPTQNVVPHMLETQSVTSSQYQPMFNQPAPPTHHHPQYNNISPNMLSSVGSYDPRLAAPQPNYHPVTQMATPNTWMQEHITQLNQTNAQNQQLISQLQSQMTSLLTQHTELIQAIQQGQIRQTIPSSIHSVSSMTNSQAITTSSTTTNASTVIPTTVKCTESEATHSSHQPNATVVEPDHQQAMPDPRAITSDSNLLTQLVKITKTTSDNTKKITTFPKFSGKDFTTWYDSILSIISSPGWNTLYDPESDDVVSTDPVNDLSAELYTALKRCLQGNAQDTMLHKKGMRSQGIHFLKLLQSTYDPKLSTVERDERQREFLSIFRKPEETIDSYGARCIFLKELLEVNGITTTAEELKTRFIMGLGPDFTSIKTALNEQNLPPRWKTMNIEELFRVASSFLNTVKSIQRQNADYKKDQQKDAKEQEQANKKNKGKEEEKNQKPKSAPPPTPKPRQPNPVYVNEKYASVEKKRQARFLSDLQNGTFDRSKYQAQVRPGACPYHGTVYKIPGPCMVLENLIEQYKHVAQPIPTNRPTGAPPAASGTARRTQPVQQMSDVNIEDMNTAKEIASAADQLVNFEMQLNDLNINKASVMNYSPALQVKCKHIKNVLSTPQNNKHSFVIDSGAFPHMWNDKSAFVSYSDIPEDTNISKKIILADGNSTADIIGIGSIAIKIDNNIHIINTVLFVPSLSTPLLSVKQHCKNEGCYFHAAKDMATLAFPNHTYDVKMKDEIFVDFTIPHQTELDAINTEPVESSLPQSFTHAKKVSCKPPDQLRKLHVSKLAKDATIPIKATAGSAGFDLFAYEDSTIAPNSRSKISTKIALSIPEGYYGRIAPRSGLSLTHNIDIGAGVIDSDYRGEVYPILINNSNQPFQVKRNSKIAQIVITRTDTLSLEQLDHLEMTKRGAQGFGHTDTKLSISQNHQKHIFDINKPYTATVKLPWQEQYKKCELLKCDNFNFEIKKDKSSTKFPISQINEWIKSERILLGHNHKISSPNVIHKVTSDHVIPKMRVVDIPPTASTKNITLTLDQLRKTFGFRNIESILHENKKTSKNLIISTAEKEPILDIGEVTTLDRPARNTTPLILPKNLGDIIHLDILFGAGTSIGGYKYALFAVDRATRHKFLYPIKSLKTDILDAIKQLCSDIGKTPTLIRTDFDHKIMGQRIREYVQDNGGHIESAPPHLQSQNGLCERNWRTLLKMSRNWLVSSLLPSSFWYHALKRATEVSNYLPIKIDNKLSTPHELAYGAPPDMRNLFPLFAVSYVNYRTQKSFANQTTKAIAIGKSRASNILEFYHPSTKSIISSAIYRFDERLVAGPSFNLPYDGGFHFNKYCESSIQIRPPTYPPESTIYTYSKIDNKYTKATVITIPSFNSDIYTILRENGNIEQVQEQEMHQRDPTVTHSERPLPTLPPWIKNKSRCTLLMNDMNKPQHGTLLHNGTEWFFCPGTKIDNPHKHLLDFEQNVMHMIETHQLFAGHPNFARILQSRNNYTLSKAVAKHVSASNLTSNDVPTLIQHDKLCPQDKDIWDAAYKEEFDGLANLPAWISITQEQYDKMGTIYKTILPTMAISTIKYDEHGRPKRAKYRIVALGNLDKYEWTKSDCYAPVMNLLELRLLTALAVRCKRKLKSGDVKQAFVQALLPDNEQYVLRPPAGCPISKPNTYWLLKRTLYGLKRSPKHWYEKAVNLLTSVGLKQCTNSPCLFTGRIIPGKPPLYLGLYVDDFVYFSESDEVEKAFEQKFGALTNVDFMGTVSHFLGIRFQYRETQNNLMVHLSQQAFSENLLQQAGLHHDSATTNPTPYRSGYPVDKVKHIDLPPKERKKLEAELRSYVGSLLWLSQGTRPDLATITNMLARYQNCPSPGHIAAAKYAIKYLKGTCEYGIQFTSDANIDLLSFVNFPLERKQITGLCDANWGAQDQSVPREGKTYEDLELFKSRSISGHVIVLHGPLHWQSKRQKITARSSAEAEIYATDQCVKDLIYLRNILTDLQLQSVLPGKTKVYNDNMACVSWSKSKTRTTIYPAQREQCTRE